jgi:ubiquinone/menaquinone biosynthesis C-methylase UbiE
MSDEANARKAEFRTVFDRLAPHYDAGPGCFAHFGRRLIEVVTIEPGQRVLDVATGRGAVLFPAIERVGPEGEVVGIDLSEGMVRATSDEVARRGLRARVLVMDAEHLDFPDQSFDAVLCGFGIMFCPDQRRALGEFRRVLRKGGRVGVSTWRRTQAAELEDVLRELGVPGHQIPGWIAEPAALRSLIQEAGFGETRVIVDEHTFQYTDVDEYWQTAQATGLRPVLDGLAPDRLEAVRSAIAGRLHRVRGGNGVESAASALIAVANA